MSLPRFKRHRITTGRDLNLVLDTLQIALQDWLPDSPDTPDQKVIPRTPSGVSSITAGPNIQISPESGQGVVTVTVSAGLSFTPYTARAYGANQSFFPPSISRISFQFISSNPYGELDNSGIFIAAQTGIYLVNVRVHVSVDELTGSAGQLCELFLVGSPSYNTISTTLDSDISHAAQFSLPGGDSPTSVLFGTSVVTLSAGQGIAPGCRGVKVADNRFVDLGLTENYFEISRLA